MASQESDDARLARALQDQFDNAPIASAVVSSEKDVEEGYNVQATVVTMPPTMTNNSGSGGDSVFPGNNPGARYEAHRVQPPPLEATIHPPSQPPLQNVPIVMGPNGEMIALSPSQTRLVAVSSLGRAMRTLATVDLVFVLMYAMFYSPLFIGLAWGPFMGYQSGKDFSALRARIYSFYYMLKLAGDLWLVANFGSFFYLFGFIIDAFICSVVVRYTRVLSTLTDQEVTRLREGGGMIGLGPNGQHHQGLPIFVVR
ncbi:hypothetical protein TrVE_jg7894 [Triparma verrucosa]|uniref:Uncharacterized protein n=1 Tax=Triparma verrucosa TaxID=1606542 RepID=A0A9W7F4Q7_9STRA|nr:hypothetical protein TrVE_jg7894 [Triparma verrucosa]